MLPCGARGSAKPLLSVSLSHDGEIDACQETAHGFGQLRTREFCGHCCIERFYLQHDRNGAARVVGERFRRGRPAIDESKVGVTRCVLATAACVTDRCDLEILRGPIVEEGAAEALLPCGCGRVQLAVPDRVLAPRRVAD